MKSSIRVNLHEFGTSVCNRHFNILIISVAEKLKQLSFYLM